MKRRIISIGMISIFLLTSFSSLSAYGLTNKIETLFKKDSSSNWTIMAYIDGDNNLEDLMIDILNQFEETGSTDNVNIVAQIDRIPGFDTSDGDWKSMRRYYITKDENNYNAEITSELVLDLGEKSMGDSKILEDFIYWAVTEYPSDHYCLFLADHGYAWQYICIDDTYQDKLTMVELKNSLKNFYERKPIKLDVLCFNACLMANVEVYYQLKDYVNIIIGSENTQMGNLGYRYFIDDLVKNPSWDAKRFAIEIIQDTANMDNSPVFDISAVDLNEFEEVVEKVNIFAGCLKEEIANENANLISDAIYSSFYIYKSPELWDLWDFANETQNYFSENNEIKITAGAVKEAVDNAVIECYSIIFGKVNRPVHGVTIHLIKDDSDSILEDDFNQIYKVLDFAKDTQWDEFLVDYYNADKTNSPPYKPNTPTGPTQAKKGEGQTYSVSPKNPADPDNDKVTYLFDWGDGDDSGWLDKTSLLHNWDSEGDFNIKIKVKDGHGSESEWSDPLLVRIQTSKSINSLVSNVLAKLLDNYPLLQRLLKL
jgi:hypothetical protein